MNFLTIDSESIKKELITAFEAALGETLNPGDERHTFLMQFLQVIVGIKNDINNSARSNMLKYATSETLDEMGQFYGCTRLPAQKATVTMRFTLSAIQAEDISIPSGTRVTPNGTLYFSTKEEIKITAGQNYVDIIAEATLPGSAHNGFTAGQIKTLVDSIAFIASVTNTTASSGGSDIESDKNYRERIRLAPESYSTAGPSGSYEYWAKTADSTISDVKVTSPSAGTVQIVPLLINGEIPGQNILDKVLAAVSSKDRRPITDNVTVVAPTKVNYDITLTYYISSADQVNESVICAEIEDAGGAIDLYKAWQCEKLGRQINPDQLRYYILKSGAARIVLTAPVYTDINDNQVAAAGTVTVTYGGLE
jgi:phage-related baseplate assembly protein